jgi:adenosine kinase
MPLFEKFDDVNTGLCLVFCHNRDRGHVTDLGASTLISQEYVNRIMYMLKDVELVYTELFILRHRKNIVYLLAELCIDDGKTFGFNLPACFFIETYFNDIVNLFEYADVVFANAVEANLFANMLGIVNNITNFKDDTDDMQYLCAQLAKRTKKNKNKKRIVVITCGPNEAHIAQYDFIEDVLSFYGSFAPDYVEESKIVDTNGAGDAFAGGFLSKLVRNSSLEECMKTGHYAASVIIQNRGCQIPNMS